jgi:hypothetical protein
MLRSLLKPLMITKKIQAYPSPSKQVTTTSQEWMFFMNNLLRQLQMAIPSPDHKVSSRHDINYAAKWSSYVSKVHM